MIAAALAITVALAAVMVATRLIRRRMARAAKARNRMESVAVQSRLHPRFQHLSEGGA